LKTKANYPPEKKFGQSYQNALGASSFIPDPGGLPQMPRFFTQKIRHGVFALLGGLGGFARDALNWA
jgi:hypothetical protein